jgi:hypothetical protein
MLNEDDIQYAIENTEVVMAPEQRIETFGSTVFRFYLVTEPMDSVGQVRVRDGRLHAERPQIIAPSLYHRLLPEGFGEQAERFANWLREHGDQFAVMKYGFQFRKTDVSERTVSGRIEDVIVRLRETVEREADPFSSIVRGVDEGWEVCLLKFATDMIQKSSSGNMDDWRRRGLL